MNVNQFHFYYEMDKLSDEQNEVIKNLKLENNIILNSCAGSGKTTTIIGIASALPNKQILILTYNRSLRKDTVEKLNNIPNTECHTFHSFGYKYYNKECFNDDNLQNKIILINLIPLVKFKFDLILIDESQDITPIYYTFIQKIINDNLIPNVQLCIIGDDRQVIYEYKGADNRYLIYSDILFKKNITRKWIKLKLTQSFRITSPMSKFINKYLLYSDSSYKINSYKEGSKLRFIETDNRGLACYLEIKYYLNLGYKPDDIFVLAPSVKTKSIYNPILTLQRLLTRSKIYIEINSDSSIEKDEKLFQNKLYISTIHGVKGLERKITILMYFDQSYYLFNKNIQKLYCPNTIYVALTRASEHTSLISSTDYFPFIKLNTKITTILDKYEYIFNNLLDQTNIIQVLTKRYPTIIFEFYLQSMIIKSICNIHNNIFYFSIKDYLKFENNILKNICSKCKLNSIEDYITLDDDILLTELLYIQKIKTNEFNYKNISYISRNNSIKITDLLEHLTYNNTLDLNKINLKYHIFQIVEYDQIQQNEKLIYDSISKQGDIFENISNIVGHMCTLYLEYIYTKTSYLFTKKLNFNLIYSKMLFVNNMNDMFLEIKCPIQKISKLLEYCLTNKQNAMSKCMLILSCFREFDLNLYNHRINYQLKYFTFIDDKILNEILQRFKSRVIDNTSINNNNIKFEKMMSRSYVFNKKIVKLIGSIDILQNVKLNNQNNIINLDENLIEPSSSNTFNNIILDKFKLSNCATIYELKMCNKFNDQDIFQLLLYAYISNLQNNDEIKYYLFNVKLNIIKGLKIINFDAIKYLLIYLLDKKFKPQKEITDKEFISLNI